MNLSESFGTMLRLAAAAGVLGSVVVSTDAAFARGGASAHASSSSNSANVAAKPAGVISVTRSSGVNKTGAGGTVVAHPNPILGVYRGHCNPCAPAHPSPPGTIWVTRSWGNGFVNQQSGPVPIYGVPSGSTRSPNGSTSSPTQVSSQSGSGRIYNVGRTGGSSPSQTSSGSKNTTTASLKNTIHPIIYSGHHHHHHHHHHHDREEV